MKHAKSSSYHHISHVSVHTGTITGIPASAAEAEINSNFNSGKTGLYMRQMLDDMGYKFIFLLDYAKLRVSE
jgi:hypothetical protein